MVNLDKKIMLNEAYPCVQGEGSLTGVPSLLLRFTGCKLRCQFAGGNLCDSHKSSWAPEKAKFTYGQIKEMIDANYPQITDIIISGGGPTSHGERLSELCNWIVQYTRETFGRSFRITMETEGSEFVSNCPIHVLSLSPKLKSSTPIAGFFAPEINREIRQSEVHQHEKWRTNYQSMEQWIKYMDQLEERRKLFHTHHRSPQHQTYLKFVVSDVSDFDEIEEVREILQIDRCDTYLMPEGITNEQLQEKRVWLIEQCIKRGYRYCERVHVVAYGNQRFV